MKVFKFGGASVNTIERIQNLPTILARFSGQPLLIVVSAMGKTTNALEKVAEAFYAGHQQEALEMFRQVKRTHDDLVKYLIVHNALATERMLNDIYTEVEWLLHDKPVRDYDYYYDQIVCVGELISTTIISAFLAESGIDNSWVDVRDVFRTDDNFRDANIDLVYTATQTKEIIEPLLTDQGIVITQGFIGSTDENESTTLGREGSDYTAAVFANLLDADSLTIWKDVEGVMNADPKAFPSAEIIRELNYDEVIEMAFYGAQVIHPKTIKPLQNKSIPLLVKCFLNADLPGTIIHNSSVKGLPPIIVVKSDQVFIELHTKDFSFIGDEPMSNLYALFGQWHIKPNLIQSGAVSVQLCMDNKPEKLEKFAAAAAAAFDVDLEKGFTLLSIRHYKKELLEGMTAGKKIRLLQQTPEIVQVLLNSNN
ncbi:MAG: aspartate kinase [Sphingobacteriales bacterium]|nr:MAG: aspartate kinase [Sphingobacteriales bacterium]